MDCEYYLAQQLHPVVSRLIDPLEGTDSARIAQCLGLDPEQYRRSAGADNRDTIQLTFMDFGQFFGNFWGDFLIWQYEHSCSSYMCPFKEFFLR